MKTVQLIFFNLFLAVSSFAQFGPSTVIAPTLRSPRISIPIDLDNDGDLDILTSSTSEKKIAWFENLDGQGNFSQSISILSGSDIGENIYTVDWDGDGDLDILAGSASTNEIHFYERINQAVVFAPGVVLTSEINDPDNIQTVDINNDGYLDLFVVDESNFDQIFYCINNGNGGLETPIQITTGTTDITTYTLGDLDGDNDLDILFGTGNINGADLHWYENIDGLGSFAEGAIVSSSGFAPSGLAIVDIDGNGSLDPVYSTSSNSKVIWVPNNGGVFSSEEIIGDAYFYASDIAVVDVDGDMIKDVVSCSGSFGEVSWWKHLDGNGTFGDEIVAINNYDDTNKFRPADFDNDGDIDFLVVAYSSDHITWIENTDGLGTFVKHHVYETASISAIQVGDLNNDGFMDIIIEGELKAFLFNPVKNAYDDPMQLPVDFSNVSLVDIDTDGDLDIVGEVVPYDYFWSENLDGLGSFSNANLLLDFNTPLIDGLLFSDIDGDQDQDCIYASPSGLIFTENEDGQGGFGLPIVIDPAVDNVESILNTDIDGDGDRDIIFTASNPDQVTILENLGLGNGFSSQTLITSEIYSPSAMSTGDLDGDGDLDLIVGAYQGKTYWLRNLGGGMNFEAPQFIYELENSNSRVSNIRIFDFDNDGDQDFIYDDECCGNDEIAIIENTDGLGDFQLAYLFDLDDGSSRGLEVLDFDFDGDQDLIYGKANFIALRKNYADDPHINGMVYWDENANGVHDSTELGMNQHQLSIEPTSLLNWTFEGGKYSFPLAPNDYILSCQPNENWELTTDSIFNITVNSNTDTLVFDFGVQAITDTIVSKVDLSSGPTRCGFTVPFWINYSTDSYQLENGFVQLELDTFVTLVSANPTPDIITDSLLTWNFSNVFPFSNNQISMEFEIAGVEFLGEVIELEAQIATEDSLLMITSSDTLSYQSTINCSYDPNDKLVEPSFENFDNYTLFGTELSYTVRFQNMGTDTAFTVRIEDQLDPNLDWNTFNVVASSHPVSTFLDDFGHVVFTFENILLPHSAIDEAGSQGFVKYDITPLDSLGENTYVFNNANIYFDFNPPIITNTLSNIYVSEFPLFAEVQNTLCYDEADGNVLINFPPADIGEFQWSTGESGNFIDSLSEGIYTVTVTLPNGDVISQELFNITSPDEIINTLSTNSSNASTLFGSAAVVSSGGTSPFSYLWSTQPPQVGSLAENLLPGTYQLTVTDANACTIVEEVIIELDYEFESNINNPLCFDSFDGSIEVLSIWDLITYEWTTGETSNALENLGTDTYGVIVFDPSGNVLTDTILELMGPSDFSITTMTSPSEAGTSSGSASVSVTGATAPYTYEWSTTPIQFTSSISNVSAGTYSVSITDNNDCTTIEELTVELMTGTGNIDSDWNFEVAPNPSSGDILISFDPSNIEDWNLKAYNSTGTIVKHFSKNDISNFNNKIKMENLPSGVYYISLYSKGQYISKKVVVFDVE